MNHPFRLLALGLALSFGAPAMAGDGTAPFYVLASREPSGVAVTLTRQADHIALSLTLSSERKKPEQQYADIAAARRLILDKAKTLPQLIVKSGALSLSVRPLSKSSGSLSLSSYSSYDNEPSSSATLTLLLPLDAKEPDAFVTSAALLAFVDGIAFDDKTHCTKGSAQLAVADPEQYRADLLKRLAKDTEQTRAALGISGEFTLEGLQNPIIVRQKDETHVELFIPYVLGLKWAQEKK